MVQGQCCAANSDSRNERIHVRIISRNIELVVNERKGVGRRDIEGGFENRKPDGSDESREQKGESEVVGAEEVDPRLLPPKEEDQGKWCKAAAVGGGQASLVRVKPKTGSRGKYKAESRRQAGATVCGTPVHSATQKKFLQRVICKPAPSKNCPGCYEVEIARS